MKSLLTITIKAPSRNDLKNSESIVRKACEEAILHINNGAKIKVVSTNADDPKEMMALMGELKWWTLDRPTLHPAQAPKHAKKSYLSKLVDEFGKQVKSIYEDEPEF